MAPGAGKDMAHVDEKLLATSVKDAPLKKASEFLTQKNSVRALAGPLEDTNN